jgi:hypothetical protein
VNTRFVTKLTGRETHPCQGRGRAQIVVEPKQELPFEIARGSEGERRSVAGAPGQLTPAIEA